jgi:uroporphyrinogen-III synthase
MRLLVTRPAPDNERTARVLRAHGHGVLLAPMLRMEAMDCVFPDEPYAGIIMTSANAARAIAGNCECAKLTTLPAFAVGRHTAHAARAAGFRDVYAGDGDRGDLARLLRAHFHVNSGPLLHLAGEDRAGDIDIPDLAVITAPIYRMRKAERFAAAVDRALVERQIDGILHFSQRSAQAYIECAHRAGLIAAGLEPLQFCLSQQIAQALAATECSGIKIAARPDEAALIELVNRER